VACRDVTPESFAAVNPHDKIVEARFLISMLLEQGVENDLEEVVVTITNPGRRLRVVDFMPKTELSSDVAGHITVVDTNETTRTADTSVGGAVTVEYGIVKATASPALGSGHQHHATTKETYERLPARELVVTSGTTDRQHGVFFKLKPSSQKSLEGMHELACLFAVPKSWRGDFAVVRCEARATDSGILSSGRESCGSRRVHVGLYLEGDVEAKSIARSLTEAQNLGPDDETSSSHGRHHTAFKIPTLDVKWFKLPTLFKPNGKKSDKPISPARQPSGQSEAAEDGLPAVSSFAQRLAALRSLSGHDVRRWAPSRNSAESGDSTALSTSPASSSSSPAPGSAE